MSISNRIIFLSFSTFAIFQLLVFIYGSTGIYSLNKLQKQKIEFEENINKLKKYQLQLQQLLNSSELDASFIITKARDLGYYSIDENLILVNNWERQSAAPDPGTIIKEYKAQKQNERPFLILALVLSLALSFLGDVIHLGIRSRK